MTSIEDDSGSSFASRSRYGGTMASQRSLATGVSRASTLYQNTLMSSGQVQETLGDKMKQTRRWFYDSDTGLIMGRGARDWGLVCLMSLLYVVVLSILIVGGFLILWIVIDWNTPKLQGAASLLQTPGLSFRPHPYIQSTLIRFYRGCFATSCIPYVDHMEAYVEYYDPELQVGERYMDCRTVKDRRPELDKACIFDLKDLGPSCIKQLNYGLNDGAPCMLLKLNKIFDWVPEEYTNIEEVPNAVKGVWDPNDPMWIHVACDGRDPVTRELMGDVSVTPEKGFPFKYFPFRNQEGYRSPLVAVELTNPTPGVLLLITCKAYARNIQHVPNQMVAETHFEVLID